MYTYIYIYIDAFIFIFIHVRIYIYIIHTYKVNLHVWTYYHKPDILACTYLYTNEKTQACQNL